MDQVKLNIGESVVMISPLKQIFHEKGDILHGLKSTDDSFSTFGEAYFTTVHQGDVKGWKKHTEMTMNLVVPVGSVKFFFFDEDSGRGKSIVVDKSFYARVTVPPGVFMAFKGLSKDLNLILNIASIPHNPEEAINYPIDTFQLPQE